jgi:predicted DNA-binding transcriptional regulator AlpA
MSMKDLDAAATLLDRKEVAKRLGLSLRTLATLVKSGQFPKPIELGYNLHRWRASTVLDWIDQRSRARRVPRPIVGRAAQLVQKQPSVKRERL